jgi:hypothetical protein
LTLRLGGIGVGHDDRLKDVPCLSLVFSVDRDSYLELFVHFLEVFLQMIWTFRVRAWESFRKNRSF